jgi:hypothetical protein
MEDQNRRHEPLRDWTANMINAALCGSAEPKRVIEWTDRAYVKLAERATDHKNESK